MTGSRPPAARPAARGEALTAVLAGGAGLLAGVATLVLHGLDWGLVLAFVTCAGSLLLVPPGAPRAAATTGWSVVVLLVARGGPGGDVVVATDVRAVFLLLLGVVLVMATAVTWPRERTPPVRRQ